MRYALQQTDCGLFETMLRMVSISCNLLQLTFILWTLAFCDEALEKFAAANALDAIVLQVAAAPREKVVRVALEALQVREQSRAIAIR